MAKKIRYTITADWTPTARDLAQNDMPSVEVQAEVDRMSILFNDISAVDILGNESINSITTEIEVIDDE